MTDADLQAELLHVAEVLERHAGFMGRISDLTVSLGERVVALHGRDEELQEGLAGMDLRVDRALRRASLLLNMKAMTLVATCRRCGCEFAAEPGPPLCGSCWTELGRPDRYLEPVPPSTTS